MSSVFKWETKVKQFLTLFDKWKQKSDMFSFENESKRTKLSQHNRH